MISFSEGLGALEFQMLVYKKVYQGLSINNKGSSPLRFVWVVWCLSEKTQHSNPIGSAAEAMVIH